MRHERILVTGGAGFIGSHVVARLLQLGHEVLNVDKLCFPGTALTLTQFADHPGYGFAKVDLCDAAVMDNAIDEFRPGAVVHLAAESHVDRSIDSPAAFIDSNISGTFNLLEATRKYWRQLPEGARNAFRFLHVSTDEVMGALAADEAAFSEDTPYRPNSPYSASKAASDHLARAWHRTYGLPTIISNCSNNYGPYQFPDKLIPLMISKGLAGEAMPVYGQGANIRDWLFVADHVAALVRLLEAGMPGERYNIGGGTELSNLQVVKEICRHLDTFSPGIAHADLIEFVADRPGHDFRYAIDNDRITTELDWRPQNDFSSGLARTIEWYIHNQDWCATVTAGSYDGGRLGQD